MDGFTRMSSDRLEASKLPPSGRLCNQPLHYATFCESMLQKFDLILTSPYETVGTDCILASTP